MTDLIVDCDTLNFEINKPNFLQGYNYPNHVHKLDFSAKLTKLTYY